MTRVTYSSNPADPDDQTGLPEKPTGYNVFSLVFFVLLVLLCVLGMVIASQYMASRPAAKVLLQQNALSPAQRQKITETVSSELEGNFFTADIASLQRQIAAMDWVQAVSISRQWPNGVMMNVVPRHPVARYGSERFLSQDGTVFQLDDAVSSQQYAHLPVMYGPNYKTADMMQQYRQINEWFSDSNMKLKEISLTDRMTWFFQFDNGLRLIVDRENTQAKLYRLSLLSKEQLKPVWSKIASIDLRYRNGMAVLWRGNIKPKEFNQARLNAL